MTRILFYTFLSTFFSLLVVHGAFSEDVPFDLPPTDRVMLLRSAIIYTTYGEISVELYPELAPWHVANFKYLADKDFYRNVQFHIHQPGYIIQGGDPTGSGIGGPKYSLPPEFNDQRHSRGALGMARAADSNNPERRSHGSQFYLTLGDSPHMDGQYTIFGRVMRGYDVLDQLQRGDRILDLKVFVRRVQE